MFSTIGQMLLGLIGLSLLVFIHELGHFLAAKKFKVGVRTFSVGFGKKIFKFKKGETEYCISVVPFGGYVAMSGDQPADDNVPRHPSDFLAKPIYQRAIIALAGPFVNIVFAIFLLMSMYMIGVREPVEAPLVVGMVETRSAGDEAGIRAGDTIYNMNNSPVRRWERFIEVMALNIGKPIDVEVHREGAVFTTQVTPREYENLGIGYSGIHAADRVVIAALTDLQGPAALAGIEPMDTLIEINGRLVSSVFDVIEPIRAAGVEQLAITLKRGKDLIVKTVTPRFNEERQQVEVGIQMASIEAIPRKLVKRGVGAAFGKSIETSVKLVETTFVTITKLVTGGVKVKALSGPIGIMQILGRTWQDAFGEMIRILALISLSLGIMNLLPLAITDGGVVMFLIIEAIRGKPLNRRFQLVVQQVAASGFILLFLYITFQDILRIGRF
jgi:regulator of sigma E protease